ncbi:hypothetical protein CDEST_07829 [Colletotrichum destructivum]|uniref:Uncharacterized protein n=1 Tax=Colletotrichum destructivum TaxID=34406 RepID=A0AAX4IIB7_9PEZI|nr:hypothetical protein CDEST_07829 [Colletotrichum destructivum]
MDPRRTGKQLGGRSGDIHRPRRRSTAPLSAHRDPTQAFGPPHSYGTSLPSDTAFLPEDYAYNFTMQDHEPEYAPYTADTSPQHTVIYSSSAPTANDGFQQLDHSAQPHDNYAAGMTSFQAHQESGHISNLDTAYRIPYGTPYAGSVGGAGPSTTASSVSSRYYPPSSSMTTPVSANTPIVSRSPAFAGIGGWAENTGHFPYSTTPPEDYRGREFPRLNIKDLPGRSPRSESTEVHRHSRSSF